MSFTGEVKEELARIDGPTKGCAIAELSALTRVCGTLSFHGSGSYSLAISTETVVAARVFIRLAHYVFGLKTLLSVDESLLHRSKNRVRHRYVVRIPEQPGLDEALSAMGIVAFGQGLVQGIPREVVRGRFEQAAYLRGVFLGGGFVADPNGDFSAELRMEGEPLAKALLALLRSLGITARINRRREAFVVYIKSFEDITTLMSFMGASRATIKLENARVMRSVKNDVNRVVNAELANQRRQLAAAQDQLALVARADALLGIQTLPAAIREFCELRRRYPDLSLAELGAAHDPPLSKSAIYHRLVRLKNLVAAAQSNKASSDSRVKS